jgi:hypothetical protein
LLGFERSYDSYDFNCSSIFEQAHFIGAAFAIWLHKQVSSNHAFDDAATCCFQLVTAMNIHTIYMQVAKDGSNEKVTIRYATSSTNLNNCSSIIKL